MKVKIPVSAVIPCYRCKNTIERAIKSIAQQTYLPEELILVDDLSDDGTIEYINELKVKFKDLNIRIIRHEKNRGPGAARNSGWEVAAMPYLAFLDADEAWHPNKLEIQYAIMVSHPEFDVCGHRRTVVRSGNTDIGDRGIFEVDLNEQIPVKPLRKISTLLRNPFATSSVMLKSEIKYRFESEKFHSEDYLLWLTCILSGLTLARIDATLASIYKEPFGEGGLSQDLIAMQKGNMANYRKLYELGLLSKWMVVLFTGISILKFIRRIILYTFRQLLKLLRVSNAQYGGIFTCI